MATREEIEADLEAQGLTGVVTPEEVEPTFGLFETDERHDPDFVYDPNADYGDDIYAPTAAEMEPDLVPPGWPNV